MRNNVWTYGKSTGAYWKRAYTSANRAATRKQIFVFRIGNEASVHACHSPLKTIPRVHANTGPGQRDRTTVSIERSFSEPIFRCPSPDALRYFRFTRKVSNTLDRALVIVPREKNTETRETRGDSAEGMKCEVPSVSRCLEFQFLGPNRVKNVRRARCRNGSVIEFV